jgi:hypothetical protein
MSDVPEPVLPNVASMRHDPAEADRVEPEAFPWPEP